MCSCDGVCCIVPFSERHGQLYLKLNDGQQMPMVGLGTSRIVDNLLRPAIRSAIKAGYRLIDTAYWYRNEEAIGAELEDIFKEGLIKREELFITTKLHPSFMGRDDVVPMLRKQLQKLRLAYVDLYMVHFPFALFKDPNGSLEPMDEKGLWKADNTIHYTETWGGMEEAVRLGLARSIGLSNFNSRQVEDVLLRADILPTVNQIESHPLLSNCSLIEFCQSRRIAVTAHSCLASPGKLATINMKNPDKRPDLMNDDRLKAIAAKFEGKTPAQVVLRWQIQRGVAVIPKSMSEERIKQNLNVFDFKLSQEDMQVISSMNRGIMVAAYPEYGFSSIRDYPFDDYRDVTDAWA